jgi:hypothetical protein
MFCLKRQDNPSEKRVVPVKRGIASITINRNNEHPSNLKSRSNLKDKTEIKDTNVSSEEILKTPLHNEPDHSVCSFYFTSNSENKNEYSKFRFCVPEENFNCAVCTDPNDPVCEQAYSDLEKHVYEEVMRRDGADLTTDQISEEMRLESNRLIDIMGFEDGSESFNARVKVAMSKPSAFCYVREESSCSHEYEIYSLSNSMKQYVQKTLLEEQSEKNRQGVLQREECVKRKKL